MSPARTAAPGNKNHECAIVQQAIAGNVDAQEYLFSRHTRRLYQIAFALLQNKEDAEDALQDALFKAYLSLRSFQGRAAFSTWLTRIVINSALMARRRKRAEASLDEILESHPEQLPRAVVDERPDPEKLCAANEITALVEKHVSQLPAVLQAAFRLHAIKGHSGLHSSKALGISASAFKSRIRRARQKLACRLKRSLDTSATVIAWH